jgi:hypothetical protein
MTLYTTTMYTRIEELDKENRKRLIKFRLEQSDRLEASRGHTLGSRHPGWISSITFYICVYKSSLPSPLCWFSLIYLFFSFISRWYRYEMTTTSAKKPLRHCPQPLINTRITSSADNACAQHTHLQRARTPTHRSRCTALVVVSIVFLPSQQHYYVRFAQRSYRE